MLVWSGAAYAEDEPSETELPEVTVSAAGLNESTTDPPVFIETIDMREFAGRMVSTEEVLRQAAGVNVRSFGGLGAYSTVSIRGSGADQVVVLVDGVRMNPAVGGGVDLSSIPPSQIERIEVIRGGDSAFFGEGAIGGVVNIITKQARGAATSTAAITYGSFNTWQMAASHSGGGAQLHYLASGSYLHTDGTYRFENDNGTTLDKSDDFTDVRVNNELDARNVLLRLNYAPAPTTDLAVTNDFYSSDSGVPGLITFPSPHVHQKLLRNISSAGLALTDLGTTGFSARTRFANRYEWSRYRDGYGEQTGVPFVSDRQEYEPEVAETLQYRWGTHQLWTLDGDYRRTMLRDPDFRDPSRDTIAASLGDQVMLWKELVTLVGVIRLDSVSDAGEQWSPKAGLALKPWPWLTAKGNIGRSFRAPSFSELYFEQGLVQGNTDLKPERATYYDAGLQLAQPWIFVEGTYFRSNVRDLIEYVLVSGFRYEPFNIGRARLEGTEWSLRFMPADYFTLSGSYTLTYAIDETGQPNRNGNQIPGRPRHTGFGRAEGAFDIFHPFVEFNYVGGNYITEANTKLLPEREIWNAGMIMTPAPQVKIGYEVKNVLDSPVVDVRGFPLPGRAMYVTFEHSFQ